jgi:hypothetical protein
MKSSRSRRLLAGVTLIELLCVFALITILASLLLGPVSHALRRARAMKWAEDAEHLLHTTVTKLRTHFAGQQGFPEITLAFLETSGILDAQHVRFLKDRRVVFTPFAGGDSEEKVVIWVKLESGFLTTAGSLTTTKGEITKPPG